MLSNVKNIAVKHNGLHLTKSVFSQFGTRREAMEVVKELICDLSEGQYAHSLLQITDSERQTGDPFDVYGVELDGNDQYFKLRIAPDDAGSHGQQVCVISLHDPKWPLRTLEGRIYK